MVDHVMERASRMSLGLQLSASSMRQSQWAAAYDSVWTLVLAYHRIALETSNFSLDDLTEEVESLTFRGLAVSDPVAMSTYSQAGCGDFKV